MSSTIETKSIDFVPLTERKGSVWSLFPLWFMSNANLTTLATGMIGVGLGATFMTSVIAILAGVAVGTIFTAFHSAQGPQLGLPQMLQSRAQFGYRGVAVICVVTILSIVGFNIFNQILAADVLTITTGASVAPLWYVLITGLALVLAIVGYHWIHRTQQWLTLLFLATFGVFSIACIVALPLPAEQLGLGSFAWPAFLVQFAGAAGYGLGWAPYVSDYSRYLPPRTSPAAATAFTYGGVFVGASWLMVLGAFVAAQFAGAAPLQAVAQAADAILPGASGWLLLAALPGLISVITVNIYAASIEGITVIDSFRPLAPTRRVRIVACSIVGGAGLLGALLSTGEFLANFGSFLVILVYVLVPWTSVNLVDYYLVRKGRYAIGEMFRPDGVYGAWGWRGLASYGIGIVAMVPFVVTAWFVGPLAQAIGGIDIALFVGLVAAAVAYLALTARQDRSAEDDAIARAADSGAASSVSFGREPAARP
ncbi:purine-cytosine permease family protein [Agrococcus sp. SGAir0287]|uniref:purine-cytosine permease family protein n=1 Tax=Agrococcus sp. SGAir0287 TaxID=2070347 RepID=UPI0010CD2E72|nr:cytosine permease [Agrococcus sp. SGAir0287]QCR20262.1 cytosine permease [Agrococcus sp. SGAir0287]